MSKNERKGFIASSAVASSCNNLKWGKVIILKTATNGSTNIVRPILPDWRMRKDFEKISAEDKNMGRVTAVWLIVL
jgi:hypothetical protein